MKKGILFGVVAVALVITLTIAIVIQTTGGGPEDVVERFVSAYNSVDLEKMLDCLEPSIARPMKSVIGLANALIGVDVNDIIGALPILAAMMPEESGSYASMPKMSCVINDTVIDGKYATVNATFTVTADGERNTETLDLHCVKVDGDWYITE